MLGVALLLSAGGGAAVASAQGAEARPADTLGTDPQPEERSHVSLYATAGVTAPVARDADLFARAYQLGPAAGLGASLDLTPDLTLRVGTFVRQYRLASASSILARYGMEAPAARVETGAALEVFGAVLSAEYAFGQRGGLRPYAIGGLRMQATSAVPLSVESERGAVRASEGIPFAPLGLHAGPGLRAKLTGPMSVFVEALLSINGTDGGQTVSGQAGLALRL
jgi:hypothetical protein